MEGNIVGEPFEDFVANQIKIRQSNQFGGYNTLRTNDQIQYLNNRNAWVKLASSVDVLVDTITGIRLEDFISSKLKNIGLSPTAYLGSKLAESAILFLLYLHTQTLPLHLILHVRAFQIILIYGIILLLMG